MEVGGSCVYARIGDRGILFDSGIRQGSGRDPLPDFRNIQVMGGIDAILVSHAHMDHTGSLPVISKAFPNAPIYMTPMTEMLTRILLADSLKKRVDFLNRTAERLGLVNVSAVHSRAEDLARDESFRDSFDFVTARAVARMNMLLEYTLPFLKPGGKFIAYKGLIAKEELSECAGALDELKGSVSGTCDFTLPFSEDRRTIAVISKTDATPSKYPRKPAKIRKKPL